MTLPDFLPVLLQILLALGMGVGPMASHFGKRRHKIKDSYECGLRLKGGETGYSVKFCITAMPLYFLILMWFFLSPGFLHTFGCSGIPPDP